MSRFIRVGQNYLRASYITGWQQLNTIAYVHCLGYDEPIVVHFATSAEMYAWCDQLRQQLEEAERDEK